MDLRRRLLLGTWVSPCISLLFAAEGLRVVWVFGAALRSKAHFLHAHPYQALFVWVAVIAFEAIAFGGAYRFMMTRRMFLKRLGSMGEAETPPKRERA